MSTKHIICDGCNIPSQTVYTWDYPNGWSKWNGMDYCPTCAPGFVVVVSKPVPKPKPRPVQMVYYPPDPLVIVSSSSYKSDNKAKVYKSKVPGSKAKVYKSYV